MPGYPDRAVALANLGMALRDRFEAYGEQADLRRAVDVLEEAVRLIAPPGEPGVPARRAALVNLGSVLRAQLGAVGQPATGVGGGSRSVSVAADAAELLVRQQVARRDKQTWLRAIRTMPATAAFACARPERCPWRWSVWNGAVPGCSPTRWAGTGLTSMRSPRLSLG